MRPRLPCLVVLALLSAFASLPERAHAGGAFDRVVIDPVALDASLMLGSAPVPPMETGQLRDLLRAALLRAFRDMPLAPAAEIGALRVRAVLLHVQFTPAQGSFALAALRVRAELSDATSGEVLAVSMPVLDLSAGEQASGKGFPAAEQAFDRLAWELRHTADRVNKERGASAPLSTAPGMIPSAR